MTEREAAEYGKDYLNDLCCAACKVEDKHRDFVRMTIKALEEIQQYRAIGTVEECRAAVEIHKALYERKLTPEDMEEYMKFSDECEKKGFTFKSMLDLKHGTGG